MAINLGECCQWTILCSVFCSLPTIMVLVYKLCMLILLHDVLGVLEAHGLGKHHCNFITNIIWGQEWPIQTNQFSMFKTQPFWNVEFHVEPCDNLGSLLWVLIRGTLTKHLSRHTEKCQSWYSCQLHYAGLTDLSHVFQVREGIQSWQSSLQHFHYWKQTCVIMVAQSWSCLINPWW